MKSLRKITHVQKISKILKKYSISPEIGKKKIKITNLNNKKKILKIYPKKF